MKSTDAPSEDLVRLSGVTKRFRTGKGWVTAVDDLTIGVRRGQSLGLVGESGSGKSTAIRLMQRLMPADRGDIVWFGEPIRRLGGRRLKAYRRRMGFVSQDPYGSLFPNRSVLQNVMEPFVVHKLYGRSERQERAKALMERVGLPPYFHEAYPHELSGGQQQRVAIARALALDPDLVLLDEAVSSLDVSIQAQIINLLQQLKEEMDLTYAFVSHNLAVIRLVADVVAVMYLGRLVEVAAAPRLFSAPRHPYTRMLLEAIPTFTADGVSALPPAPKRTGTATPPDPGCPFEPRCPLAVDRCREETPVLAPVGGAGDRAACHRVES